MAEDSKWGVVYAGFRFGAVLQLAVGPVCMFVLGTAASYGFWQAMGAVSAVVLTDALYIFLAIIGLGALLKHRPALSRVLQIAGGAVMVAFGAVSLLGVFGLSLTAAFHIPAAVHASNAFLFAALLTLSNPLTILFWTGVFTSRLAERSFDRLGCVLFGLGAMCSTAVFLSLTAALGGVLRRFSQGVWSTALNALVGVVLIGFGLRTLLKKRRDEVG